MTKTKFSYKYFAPLAMLYMVVALCDVLSIYRITNIGSVTIAGGIYVLPFYYFLEDVITEVYGYQRFRQVVWTMLFGCFLFAVIMTIIVHLPSPKFWHHQGAYDYVFSHLFRITFGGGCIAILSGAFVNSFVVSKWKILTRGKYFWLRSLGSSAIGQAIQNVIGCLILYTGVLPFEKVLGMILPLYSIQLGVEILIILPGAILVKFLKKAEGCEAYDYHTNFNPFKYNLENEEIVQYASDTTLP